MDTAAEKSKASSIAPAADPRRRLLARNSIDEDDAFELLRDHSQHSGRKLADLADAVLQSHLLLLPQQANARARTEDGL